MFKTFITKRVLRTFFSIELTSGERMIAVEAADMKYSKALQNAFFYCLLSIFPILFLDTTVIISVLIPITMVAGTAWFAISLANMKQKFERFGLELTVDFFEAYSISLGLLFLLSVFSLSDTFWRGTIESLPYQNHFRLFSFIAGVVVVGNISYKILIGSIKYDVNDSMLTGQSEAAERFYRKSLSLLHSVANSLREGKSIQVANYYIGVAFFEVFAYVRKIGVMNGKLAGLMEQSNSLVKNPSMPQEEADRISLNLIKVFMSYCVNPQGSEVEKSMEAIKDELQCLENNKNEDQEMVDTRLAIIFQEIASALENQGETLFLNPKD